LRALDRWHPKPIWFEVLALGLAVLTSGCQPERAPAPAARGDSRQPADSLALSNGEGLEVWFTLARTARASDGKECVERGLEIRRAGSRVPVPLLYTAETPTLLNDTTMRAVLWTHCKPVDPYLVDLRSGRPVREPGAGGR
jgi:hypothetical protein